MIKVPAPKADEDETERPSFMLGTIVQLNDKPAPRKGPKKRPIGFMAKAEETEEK